MHKSLFQSGIHMRDHFLPWHRWYILQYENLLRQVDCSFTVSYWDWSEPTVEPWGTGLNDIWHSNDGGFGGNGNGTEGCVQDGPFKQGNWSLVPSADAPKCLKRQFMGTPPTAQNVAEVLQIHPRNFTDFEIMLAWYLHGMVHCLIGGTMCSSDAASAPEFFLHHGHIDKVFHIVIVNSFSKDSMFFIFFINSSSLNSFCISWKLKSQKILDF